MTSSRRNEAATAVLSSGHANMLGRHVKAVRLILIQLQ
jgi:hypothetical protein